MEGQLYLTSALLLRSKQVRHPIGRPALRKLVQVGFVDPAIRPGLGRGKGRAGLWTSTSLRQISAWCRLRETGLRGKRLAFAMWWETGVVTPQIHAFMDDVFTAFSDFYETEVYGKRVPADVRGRRDAVRRYIARTSRSPSPADAFDQSRGRIEFATIAGVLGLLTPERSAEAQIYKVLPKITERGTAEAGPTGLQDLFVTQYAPVLGLSVYALSPYASLGDFRRSLDLLAPLDRKGRDSEAAGAAQLLREIRTYLRRSVALLLHQSGGRKYWKVVRASLRPLTNQVRTTGMPRSLFPYRHLLTQEGTLAMLVLIAHRVHMIMTESGIEEGLKALTDGTGGR